MSAVINFGITEVVFEEQAWLVAPTPVTKARHSSSIPSHLPVVYLLSVVTTSFPVPYSTLGKENEMVLAPKLDWTLQVHEKELDVYRCGANLKIVLHRPRNGNALTTTMVAQLTDCFRLSAADRTVSRIIITAEGRFFCTGMDLGESSTGVGRGGESGPTEYRKFTELFAAIQAAPQVTIAAINGPCYAGGVGLAFSCDVRLAIESATVTVSEVRLGMCPAIISKYLVREWGAAFTREAMLSGRTIPMAELRQLGAVHGLAGDVAELEALLDSYVTNLRACAPRASAMCKTLVRIAGQERQDEEIRRVFEDMMRPGSESSIGVRNFQSKRKTDWDGISQALVDAKL